MWMLIKLFNLIKVVKTNNKSNLRALHWQKLVQLFDVGLRGIPHYMFPSWTLNSTCFHCKLRIFLFGLNSERINFNKKIIIIKKNECNWDGWDVSFLF